MTKSFKCPVCGKEMMNTICNNCGYTLFLYPKEVPPQVEKFEQTRVRIMKDCLNKITGASQSKEDGSSPAEAEDHIKIVGTLIIHNLMTESIYAYPIKEGRNLYGRQESNDSVRIFVDPLQIGIDIPEIMFAISAGVDGLTLIPNRDYELSHNRYLIDRIMELENDDFFFHSNFLSFNAVKF